jgi:hypothetical protein
MDRKLPVGYFFSPDGFISQKLSNLFRQCLYKLNCAGAMVTNIVMDNYPVKHATFCRLGCKDAFTDMKITSVNLPLLFFILLT